MKSGGSPVRILGRMSAILGGFSYPRRRNTMKKVTTRHRKRWQILARRRPHTVLWFGNGYNNKNKQITIALMWDAALYFSN